jgi:ATP-dependent helicase Lhr and Lhr-like helicase
MFKNYFSFSERDNPLLKYYFVIFSHIGIIWDTANHFTKYINVFLILKKMISFKDKPDKKNDIINIMHPYVKQWFFSKFKDFSLPQLYGVMEIHSRNNILVSAPTGATKTLTGFLSIINELVDSAEKKTLEDKVYCIYISPLKALNEDIKFNLINPLNEINAIAGKDLGIRIGVRTGDTSQKEKTAMSKKPPHILITTPESLGIMLSSSKFVSYLKNLEWCIIDEIHSIAENKRGVHLSLSLEWLQLISGHFTRIGLSATVAPLEEIAKYLVGYELKNKKFIERDCKIIDVQYIKELDLKVLSPVPNLINTSYEIMHNSMYTLMNDLIQKHTTTLIFTNTRSATERVVNNLKDKFPKLYNENIGAHHGSLSKEHRHSIEQNLREGKLKVVVSSTSLELGIDIGFVDLVILLGSPKSVARAIQRCGRAGHQLHQTTKGRIIVMDRDDLIECSVLLKSAIEKKIDKIHIPKNCLDVLAQQIYGISIYDRITYEDLLSLVKRSYNYNTIDETDFRKVIDYLAGKYSSLEDRNVYAKIFFDEETRIIGKRGKLARMLYMTNIGTIPDETYVKVKINDLIVGEIDEAFLERLKRGDVFVLGGNRYEFLFARGMTAQVKTSVDRPPTIPNWFSETLPLSFDLAMEIQRFRRLMEEKFQKKYSKDEIISFILKFLHVDDNAANAIYTYFKEQYSYSVIPNDKKIIIEHYEENNEKIIVFHTLFGRRVNDCLSRAVALAISKLEHKDIEIGIGDNGFYIRGSRNVMPLNAFKILKSDKLDLILNTAIDKTEVLKRRFRHCATRSLMILRNYMGRTKKVGRQQVSSMLLINAVKRIDKDFPILKEARREVLHDLMDIENTKNILRLIEKDQIKIQETFHKIPSPFSFNLVMQGHLDLMKIEDKMDFLKNMHQLVLAKISMKVTKKEFEEFDYYKEWKKIEEKEKNEEEQKIENLKIQLWNLDQVPSFAKHEIIRLIDGETIRQDVLNELINRKKEIKKEWSKELFEFVFNKIEE